VLVAVKARPGNAAGALRAECRPALTPPARGGCEIWRSGWKNARGAGRTKEWDLEEGEEAGGLDLQDNCACVLATACHNGSSLRTQWVH
jgi:hypothetical protein